MKLKNSPLASLICVSLLESAALSQAEVSVGDIISVNLAIPGATPTPSGAAVIGGVTDTWNQVLTPSAAWESSAAGTYSGLTKTTGAASGVSLTFGNGAVAHGISNAEPLDIYKSAFAIRPNTSATVSLSGLGAGTTVDLYLYSGGYQTGEGATFNFGTGAFTATNTVSQDTTYVLNDNYVKIAGLVADGSGNITGTWTAATSGNYSTFNGVQIEVTVTSGTWTNPAGGQWGTAGNWLTDIVATGTGSTADFNTLNITADTTVDLDSARTIGNLVFGDTDTSSAAGWTLTGNTLTLAGSTPTITVNSLGGTKTVEISAPVTGAAGLTKAGTGTLTLTGANSYAGDTTITVGTLQIGDGDTNGTLGSGAVTIESGAFLTINRSDNYGTGSSQVFSGAGTITKEGTGDLVFYGGSDHTNVQGIDNVVVNNGLIRTDYYGQWNSNLALAVNDNGILELWSASQSLGTLNGSGTVQNTRYYDRATTLTVAAGSFSGTITDSGITSGGSGTGDTRLSLLKSGSGTLSLSGTLSYGGSTTVQEGTLSIGNGGNPTDLSDSATVSIAFGATMNLNFTGSDTVGVLEINGSGPLPAGTYDSSHLTYGSYFAGSGSLVVPVTATDYDTWAGPSGYNLSQGSSGDDDSDGQTNFEEYAFGLIPNSGSSVNPIASQLSKSTKKFSYTRRKSSLGTNLTYSVWFSENLTGWTQDTGATEGTSVASGDNETVEVTLSALPGDPLPAKLFIQVRAD
jgi:autotransporter-associated beta strand protein